MYISNILSRNVVIVAVALSVNACDSGTVANNTVEPTFGAALNQNPDNLLVNGGFELTVGGDNWRTCSTISDYSTDATSTEGAHALSISSGTCLSQTVQITAGTTYTFSCDARNVSSSYSNITFGFTDDSTTPVDAIENAITGTDYTTITNTMTALPTAVSAELLIFSEGEANVDNCTLVPTPKTQLKNSDFSRDLAEWQECENSDGNITVSNDGINPANNKLTLSEGGCAGQVIDISNTYDDRNYDVVVDLTCSVQYDEDGYASITLGYLDENLTDLTRKVRNISANSTDGVFKSSLLVPVEAHYAEVEIYSASTSYIDSCSISY